MTRVRNILLLLTALLALASCHTLESESGLYDVELEHSYKVAVDGAWSWGKGNPFPGQKRGKIYVAPMDVSLVAEDEPELAPKLAEQMHTYMVEALEKELADANKTNHTNWKLTERQAEADVVVNTALVHFRKQHPVLRVASFLMGPFVKVPGVSSLVKAVSKGDICAEAAVRNAHTGDLLLAFKDSNRKNPKLYEADAYTRTGNADSNLQAWAVKFAKIIRACSPDMLGDGSLKQQMQNRTLLEAAKARISY